METCGAGKALLDPEGDQIEQVYEKPIKIQFLGKAFLNSNSGSFTTLPNLGKMLFSTSISSCIKWG